MRQQTLTDHIECSNRKPVDFEDSRPRSDRQFWIMRNLQSELGHTGRMVRIEQGCTCTKRSDTYSSCEWQRRRSACGFDTCLASPSNVFLCDLFCVPKTLICGKNDQTRLWSVCELLQLVWYIYIVNIWCRLKDACVKKK